MFTVQTANSNEDESHPINVQFANEASTVQEITSHDLENHDLGEDEGHTLEHIEGQCSQPLGQTDVTSVHGSYVSLLADIATIEQTDEYSDQPIAQDISDTVDYTAAAFTGQELVSIQNDNLVSYQTVDNQNIGYNLTNQVGNAQQFIIIQPFLGDTSVNGSSTLIHLPNSGESQLSLDSNKELEDAVANITEKVVADTDESLQDEGSAKSFLVSTNSHGEVREIQVVQEQNWDTNETEVSTNNRKSQQKHIDKDVKGKQKKSVITERKESSSHLKKFSLDDLNSAGKSKKEVFEEFLEKSKAQNEIQGGTKGDVSTFPGGKEKLNFDSVVGSTDTNLHDTNAMSENSTQMNIEIDRTPNTGELSLLNELKSVSKFDEEKEIIESNKDESVESQVLENLHISAKENESAKGLEDEVGNAKELAECVFDPKNVNKDSVAEKKDSIGNESQTSKSKTRSRQAFNKKMKAEVKVKGNMSNDSKTSLYKEKNVKLKNKCLPLKRKNSMPNLKQSSKLPKIDDMYEKNEEMENNAVEDDIETRVLEDFCRLFRSEKKCILHLEPITLKLVNPNHLLMIEMDVEEDISVSSIEKGVTADGFTKYFVQFTLPEKVEQDSVEEFKEADTEKKEVERTYKKTRKNELKRLKKSRGKQIKVIKEKKLASDNETKRALRTSKANTKESHKKSNNDTEDLDNEIMADVINNESTDTQRNEDYQNEDEEIETEIQNVDELEPNEKSDISSKDSNNATKCKKKKAGKISLGKKSAANKSSVNDVKDDSSQKNYSVVVSDDGRKMYRCDICGKEMSIRQNMDVHINQHTGQRPWQCEVCGLGFRGPSNLKAHMNQHDEEMRFSCAMCFKKFRDRGTYRQHLKRHLGEKKHVCEHCGKSFVITSDLKKHIRTHTGEKPFKCPVCDQQFSDGSSLVRHEKIHGAKFRYECNACRRQYSRRDLCKKHIKKAHTTIGEVEINEISIVEDINQIPREVKTKSQDHQVKLQKMTRKSLNRETVPNSKVKKLKKSWQTLTEEASKRYKEQTNQTIAGTSQYREYTHPAGRTFSVIDYQAAPVVYGNINQKFPDQQKSLLPGYTGQEITQQGPLVFQSYLRNIADSDI